MLKITSQWQDHEISIFVTKVHNKKGRMLKSFVPKFHHDISVRLKDIAEMQVHVHPKPIVSYLHFNKGVNHLRCRHDKREESRQC